MINKVILIGNVGKDPEVRYFDNNEGVANFPLATTEPGFTTRDGRQIPERTEWHNIQVRRGLVKVAETYIKKGTQLYIEGKLRTRSYEQNGVTKYITEVVVDTLKLLGRKADNPAATNTSATASSPAPTSSPASGESPFAPPQSAPPMNEEGFTSGNEGLSQEEDDLPF